LIIIFLDYNRLSRQNGLLILYTYRVGELEVTGIFLYFLALFLDQSVEILKK